MNHSVFLYLVSLFIYINTFAQNFPVKYIDISSGLSNNSVTSIYQDRNGYLWFGTFDGLNKYDGYEFKVFRNNSDDASSLQNNYVYCIEGDNKNNIWIGRSNGASVYNQSQSSFITLRYRLQGASTSKLLNDAAQKIVHLKEKNITLVATLRAGLLLFKDDSYTGSAVPFRDGAKRYNTYDATAVAYTKNENFCYVFVNNIGLCKYTLSINKLEVINRQHKEANCFELNDDGLWMGTDEGVFLYNEKTNLFSKSYLPQKALVRSLMTNNSDIWIATDGKGVYKLAKNAPVAVIYNHLGKELLRSNAVWSLFKDSKGQKWFGTLRGGLSLMGSTPLYFNSYRYKSAEGSNSHIENFILSFCEDKKRNVWIGTDGAGLRYWDRARDAYTRYSATAPEASKKIPSNFVTSIVQDEDDAVWVSMWGGGISCINRQNNTIKHFSCFNPFKQKEDKDIWVLFMDSRKNLWAGASNNGALYKFDKTANKFVAFNKGLTDVKCLYETTDGKIWGGSGNAVFSIDPVTNTYEKYGVKYTVRSILEDKQKQLWIGTAEGGLLLFDRITGLYNSFTMNNGLPSNTVLRILEDKKGNLWMSTYNGLSRFNPQERSFRNFTVSDGLQSNQFNFNAGLSLSSGEFIFGGINGFTMFTPEMVKDHKTGGKILLNDIVIDNKPLDKNNNYVTAQALGNIKSVSIPYEKSTLSLDFVNLEFIHPDKVNYAYILDGWDTKWNFSGTNRKANYSRLHEGTYIFKVKTTNIYGKWGNAATLLTIKILPPWYRSWWAYTFYFLAVAGIVYTYLRYSAYRQKLRYEVKLARMENRKEKELSEKQLSMFTFIAHELRTPLSLIINPLKLAIKYKDDGVDNDVDFTVAYRNARRLLSLTDQLLLFRKAESDADELKLSSVNLNDLCNEVYQYFINRAKEQEIAYSFISSSDEIEILGDYEKIEIALFNIVSNAFKYTPKGGIININLTENQAEATVEISDTGCGIDAQDTGRVFEKFKQVNSKTATKGFGIGLYVTRYFITKHQGTVGCTSILGKGSTFTIMLLKGYDHFADMPVTATNSKMSEFVEELLADTFTPNHTDNATVLPTADVEQITGMSSKRSILIIEDNNDIRDYLVQLFSKTYTVYSAEDGTTGYTLTEKYLPDVVLSDVTMEGLDGLELCKKIKQNDRLSHIPVVLLTAVTNPETHLQGINEGADDYILKPFDSDILMARIEALLRNRSQLRKYFLDRITLNESNYKIAPEYKEFLQSCIEIVEANIDNKDFSLKSFSVAMGMSHSGLYKKIKAISGQTVNAFIRSIRLRRAAVLLLTENVSIAQAGYQVGIEDPRYFREQFVKLFGMTPSQYKKKYRNSFNKELNIIQE